MKPLLHIGGGDLIAFEIKRSRGADSTVFRLVGFNIGREKEVPDIRYLGSRVYSMDIVQSHDIPTDYSSNRYLINIANSI